MVLCKETMYTGIDDLKKAVHFFKSSLSVYIVRNEFEGGVNQFKSASVVLRQWPCKLNPCPSVCYQSMWAMKKPFPVFHRECRMHGFRLINEAIFRRQRSEKSYSKTLTIWILTDSGGKVWKLTKAILRILILWNWDAINDIKMIMFTTRLMTQTVLVYQYYKTILSNVVWISSFDPRSSKQLNTQDSMHEQSTEEAMFQGAYHGSFCANRNKPMRCSPLWEEFLESADCRWFP